MMNFLVESLAIKSRRDLIVKPVLFIVIFLAAVNYLEVLLMPEEDRQTPLELLPMLLVSGSVIGGLLFSLVTHQHNLQHALHRLAMTDSLTNLPNRRAFLQDVKARLDSGELGYLMIADADHFKAVNDSYGHAAGDAALCAIAARLREVAEPGDVIGRLGGEEFGIFLNRLSHERLLQAAANLIGPISVTSPAQDKTTRFHVTLSLGATEAAQSASIEQMLHRADVALYVAKTNGRACLEEWIPPMEEVS